MNTHNKLRTVGVIDIGSNSVRLVAYDLQSKPPSRFFNEKVICRLGSRIDKTGKLSKKGVDRAKTALKGFLTLAEAMHLDEVYAVATAAIREAEDGAKFVEKIEKKFGIKIDVIDGEQEAALSAYGVLSAFDHAYGVVGDLGGGSLELAKLDDKEVSHGCSLPLGVLRIPTPKIKDNEKEAKDYIESQLGALNGAYAQPKNFYAVGGSWRAIAVAHQLTNGIVAPDSHGYSIETDELAAFAKEIGHMSPKKIIKHFGFEKKRADMIPAAGLLIRRILTKLEPENVIFSNAGLRDGLIYCLGQGEGSKFCSLQGCDWQSE